MSADFGPSDDSGPKVDCHSAETEVEMQGRVIVADHAQLEPELIRKRDSFGLVQTQEPGPVDLGCSVGLRNCFVS
jgi:hypothetical protein